MRKNNNGNFKWIQQKQSDEAAGTCSDFSVLNINNFVHFTTSAHAENYQEGKTK